MTDIFSGPLKAQTGNDTKRFVSLVTPPISKVVLYVLVALVFFKLYRIYQGVKAVKGLPRLVCGFSPLSVIGSTLPTSSWNPGLYFVWDWKNLYQAKGSELISVVPLISGQPLLYTSSPEIFKQVLGFGSTFEKSEISLALNFIGPNVVATKGEQWRRHRKVTAPIFNQSTFRNVWIETAKIYEDMVKVEGWNAADTFFCKSFNRFTTKVALLVISACGFGVRLPWNAPPVGQGKMSIHETIVTVASSVLIRLLVPRWAYYLPVERLHQVETAYVEFEKFMKEHIASRRSDFRRQLKLGIDDNIFGRLVEASETDDDARLDDDELLGNYFIFLFAGHETTAHTLVVTLALLGIHQEEQDRVFKHIKNVYERGPDVSFEDIQELSPVLSCFYEAVRLYPPAFVTIRDATEDTILTYPSISRPGTEASFLVRRGTQIALDQVGANRNARHYPEPDLFKPSRWDESVGSVIAFSLGPRACLGRKFATTEATCFLTHILRDWKVDIALDEGENATQWESRVLYPKIGMTLTTGDVPLRFTRRVV